MSIETPRLPPPDWLRGADQDHPFAYQTLSKRLPGIARQVLENHDWSADNQKRLQALIAEMPHSHMRPLQDPDAPDSAAWERDFAPYVGQTWLEAPWFVAEMYFFRRILEATGYYQGGPGQGIDPYRVQKLQDRARVAETMSGWLQAVGTLCAEAHHPPEQLAPRLARLLHRNIWGNQADRSMWPGGAGEGPIEHTADQQAEYLLVDDALAVSQYLLNSPWPRRVDIVLDNCGIELALDLGLADALLHSGIASAIQLHVKPHPTYVSDATGPDVQEMADFLVAEADPAVKALGRRLQDHLATDCIAMATDYFWTAPLSGWEMPGRLYIEFDQSSLIISKGDANYRRWLGDRHWPTTTPIGDILSYLPAPWLALRVLKANIAAGLKPGKAGAASRVDALWQVSGHWGMIQFCDPV